MLFTRPKEQSDNESAVCNQWKDEAEIALFNKLETKVPGLKAVIIKSLRVGSIVIDYETVIDEETHPDSALDLAMALVDLAKGQLTIDNQAAALKLTVEELKVDLSTSPCDVFKTVTTCPAQQECQMKEGSPSCQALPQYSGAEDDRPLYLTVGSIVALSAVMVFVTVCVRRRCASAKKDAPETAPAGNTFNDASGKLQGSWPANSSSVAPGSSLSNSRNLWRLYTPGQQ
ncbi:hypothetical protein V1264_008369 [Littorina saxatilis]|uniref:SEA domain-containing protein n=2 Tax=Littorina saxatilis TaxID=31220 RepID=A0AAN9G283_9CAEN